MHFLSTYVEFLFHLYQVELYANLSVVFTYYHAGFAMRIMTDILNIAMPAH